MRELTFAEIQQVDGGLSTTEKQVITALAMLCPLVGGALILGYHTSSEC